MKISRIAKRDLDELLVRLAEKNPVTALEIYDELVEKIRDLKHTSHVWRRIGEGRQERIVRKTWGIVYRVEEGSVIVLRVWDFRRNPANK